MRQSYIRIRTVLITVVITAVIMMILLYAPSPFVVMKPGIAVPAQGYVQTNNDNNLSGMQDPQYAELQEEGELLLTAVLLKTPNLWEMLASLFSPADEVRLKVDVLGRSSMEEYTAKVTSMMRGSHNNALEAAYRYLQIPYSIQPQQLIVQQARGCKPGCAALEAGDEIVAGSNASGVEVAIHSVAQLHDWIADQTIEDEPYLIIKRSTEQLQQAVNVEQKDGQLEDKQLVYELLNVDSFIELRAIEPDDPLYKVEITTDNIGGPSAGLVLALTIINQLTAGDLTNGKKIAVTGTIDADGNVGSIGGIIQKVYSTSEQGAHLFIVPKGNEKEAKRTMKRINSDMEIIGVATLEEAMQVIASLQ